MKKNYKEPNMKVVELADEIAIGVTGSNTDNSLPQLSRQNAWDDDDEEDW